MTAVTAQEIAERLDMSYGHVCAWVRRWRGPGTRGQLRSLTVADLMVSRAWQVLGGQGARWARVTAELCDLAERAIRADPQRWLIVSITGAATFTEAEHAVEWAVEDGMTFWWLIDLWSLP